MLSRVTKRTSSHRAGAGALFTRGRVMKSVYRNATIAAAASAAAIVFAAPAQGAVTVSAINGPNLATQIHASTTNSDNDTTVVYGSTLSGGNSADVKFTGNTAVHITDGAGFASITDANNTPDLRVLTIELTKAFTALQFSIQLVDAGSVIIQYALTSNPGVFLTAGGANPFSQNANTLKDYQITATGSDVLAAIRITSCTVAAGCVGGVGSGTGIGLEKQNSVTLAAVSPVPEPSTWALMLLGFGGMGVAMRRSRRRGTSVLAQMA